MSWADRELVDEISQCDRGVRYLLRYSESPRTQALVDFLEDYPGNTAGKFFLHEAEADQLPGEITTKDRPCLVLCPASLAVEAWRQPQVRLTHALALMGLVDARNAEPVNRFVMLTLRALFQRKGRIPDTLIGEDTAGDDHDPEVDHLDHVQTMRIASPIQRTPIAPLSKDQASDLDDEETAGFKTWGFRVVLGIDLRADILEGA